MLKDSVQKKPVAWKLKCKITRILCTTKDKLNILIILSKKIVSLKLSFTKKKSSIRLVTIVVNYTETIKLLFVLIYIINLLLWQ